MSILAWVLVGFIAGTLAAIAIRDFRGGCLLRIAVGVIGAILGGWLFSLIGQTGVTGFNLWSIFVAFVGAVVFLVIVEAVTRRK